MKKRVLLFFLLNACTGKLFCQDKAIDSIKAIIANPPSDTALVNAWLDLDNLIYMSDPQLDEDLNKKVLDFCEKKIKNESNKLLLSYYKTNLLVSVNNLGIINMYKSSNEEAKKYFNRAVLLSHELGNKQKIAAAYNNFGVLYYRQGNYSMSIDYYTKGLQIMESADDKLAMAGALNNIGNMYREVGDTAQALSTFRRSMLIGKKINAKSYRAVSLSSIAEIYNDEGKNDSAEVLLKESLALDEELGNKQGIGSDLANLAKISLKKGDYAIAKEKAEKALALFGEVQDQRAQGLALSILSDYYSKTGDLQNAVVFGKKGLNMLMAIGQIEEAEKVAETLYHVYKLRSDYKNALEMKELYSDLHDTLQNERNTRAVIHQEFKYEYDKRAALDNVKHQEETKVQKAELAKKDAIQLMLFIGLGMFLIFSIFIYNRFKVTAKQNKIIEKQKEEVEQKQMETEMQRALIEEKNRSIVDSIRYAKRIQDALLPNEKYIDKSINKLKKK